jgi:hypothetical protein
MTIEDKNDRAFVTLITPDRLGTDVMCPAVRRCAMSLGDLWMQPDIHQNTREGHVPLPDVSRNAGASSGLHNMRPLSRLWTVHRKRSDDVGKIPGSTQ